MALSLADKKALTTVGTLLVGFLFLRRLFGKGDVFIDRVDVQKAEWTPADDRALDLSERQRRATELLAVDLDLMAPTRRPTPLEQVEIEETIAALKAGGRTGEANFLSQLLGEALAQGLRNQGGEA